MAQLSEQSRILKADAVRGMDAQVAFNYDDFKARCNVYLEQAQQQAQNLLTKAKQETAQVFKQAQEQGYAAGHAEGLKNANAAIQQQAEQLANKLTLEKLKTTLPAVQAVADQLVQDRNRWLTEWENATIKLAIAIAEKIVGQQIATTPHLATNQIQHLLSLAVGSSRIRVHLNPNDLDGLGAHAEQVVQSLTACGEVQLCPDENITPGGCIIETEHGTVDALVESQLEHISHELLNES